MAGYLEELGGRAEKTLNRNALDADVQLFAGAPDRYPPYFVLAINTERAADLHRLLKDSSHPPSDEVLSLIGISGEVGAAALSPLQLQELLRALDSYSGS